MDPLDTLLIERACERLCTNYARRVDTRAESFADLFTDDGVLTLVNVDLSGREEILAYIRRSAAEGRATRHLYANIAIDVVSADEARGVVDMLYFTGRPGEDGVVRGPELKPAGVGTYTDVYRRTADGWRIARRAFKPVFLREGKPRAEA